MHSDWLVSLVMVPAGQSTAAPALHALPGGHSMQSFCLVNSVALLQVPSSQAVGAELPCSQYVPSKHGCGTEVADGQFVKSQITHPRERRRRRQSAM